MCKLNEVHDGRLQVALYALSEELCCSGGAGPRGTGTATRTFEAPLRQHFQPQKNVDSKNTIFNSTSCI